MNQSNDSYITEYETDVAKIKVRFNDTSNLTRERVFNRIAQAAFNLCIHEHEREMRVNKDE